MRRRFTTIKAVTKTVVDYCVLPGTATGAEILWLYTMQWKNRLSMIALALISFAYSHMTLSITQQNESQNVNGPENTR